MSESNLGYADEYRAFLEGKFKFSVAHGFDVAIADVNPHLKPHTREIVRWALKGGRRAIFAAFGLHKTSTQIEIMRLIMRFVGGRCLIVIPLGVRQEFFREVVERFQGEYAVKLKFIRRAEEIEGDDVIYLTNYESIRDGKLDPNLFIAATLDEASVLRSFGSKTYQEFLTLFDGVKYRFVATATPSPNRFKELIHYAGFLGVMDTGHALTRFFQRDSEKAGNLTLYPHMEQEFFVWLHSWAIFVQKPSDLGYSDDGYALPPMQVRYHEVKVRELGGQFDRDGQGQLIKDAAIGLKDAAAEKRESIDIRVAKMLEIVRADPDSHYILWHDLEDERHAIKAALPAAVSVYGSQDLDAREQAIIDFSDGKYQYLSTKKEIAGSGCNFQRHCYKAIFTGIDYRFNDFIQAIHRIFRFGQVHGVEIHIIFTETEREILAGLQGKWAEDDRLRTRMSEIIREHGLSTTGLEEQLSRSIGITRREERGDMYLVANNDCVEECRLMETNSVGQIVTSIPFGNLYQYSESYNDFGHTESNGHFWRQMDFLTPHLLRVLEPGRLYCCHVKDRIVFGNVAGTGAPTVSPFHAEAIFHCQKHGFDYMGMVTVVTDVVRENNQTYRLGWSEQCKDGTKMGVGSPEYVLLFRKPQTDRSKGYADVPVKKGKLDRVVLADGRVFLADDPEFEEAADGAFGEVARLEKGYSRGHWQIDAHALWRSSGNRYLTADELSGYGADQIGKVFTKHTLETIYDYRQHVRLAEELDARGALPSTFMSVAPGSHHPDVWHDINRMRTLNGEQAQKNLVQHVCPIQFDIVDRLIDRYSNKGDLVFDPFGGLMTVPVRAMKLGRRGRAVELNEAYFRDGLQYCVAAEREASMPDLFDFEDLGATA